MSPHDILKIARKSISDEKNWGNASDPSRGNGCALIAMLRASNIPSRDTASAEFGVACRALERVTGFDSIPYWNDSHTHAQVLAGFDKAIASLEPKRARKTDITPFLDILKSAKDVETV